MRRLQLPHSTAGLRHGAGEPANAEQRTPVKRRTVNGERRTFEKSRDEESI
jgi:hypothetical protein